jgi:hypothetical protein
MTDLIKRLEEAEVGSRELDEEIHDLLCASKEWTCVQGLSDADGGLWMYEFPGHNPSSALRVTTSLDAALALAERVLPGCLVSLFLHGNAAASVECKTAGRVKTESLSATPALALCIAILKATDTGRE